MRRCATCETPMPNAAGTRRKFCSGRCRKAQYAQPCVECGAPTSGSEGRKPEPRCRLCAARRAAEANKVWTRGALLTAIREWAIVHGEAPAVADWDVSVARLQLRDEARARRFEGADGRWPCAATVRREFGSWAGALTAAGFEPRAAHGGAGNELRRRRAREKAAA